MEVHSRVTQLPNGNENQCQTCHTISNPSPGNGPRNDFGKLIEAQFLTEPGSNGEVIWNALLASLDADNDGISNGVELQDRFGAWEKCRAVHSGIYQVAIYIKYICIGR